MDPIIEICDASFEYPAEEGCSTRVFEHLNFSIERGSFTAVLGHNGSGKSTMAKCINGLIRVQSGQVRINGLDVADEANEIAIRRKVGMVFQNPDNQLVSTIVEEDVAFGPENLGVPPEQIRRQVDRALEAVGMMEYARHDSHRLSGGQKQRIAIAGMLAMEPDCLVLDEPTAMLDPQGRQEVMSTIRRLNREEGMTIVLITHYMNEAALADRVVVMDDGKLLLDGTPKDVFRHVEELKAVGLDVPQPTELAWELNRAGFSLPDDLLEETECVDALAKALGLEQ